MPVPANYNILGTFLDAYSGAINSGFGLINGDVTSIMGVLSVISIALAAIFWMLDETENVIAPLVRQILKIGFFVWIVNDWQGLTQTVINGFAATGLKAGGSGVAYSTFLNNPGNIVIAGFKHAMNEFNLIEELTGPVDFFTNLPSILVLFVSALGIIVAFFVIAVQLVVTLIEFRLVSLAAFILIPFGILNKTSFLAERSFGYVVSAGLKVLTIALIVTIGGKTFDNIALVTMGDTDSMFMQAMSVMLAAVLMMMLSLTIPSVAAALVTGGPQLGAGAALAGTAGLAASAGGAYLAGRAALRAPGAIAAKAQAAAGSIRTGAQSGVPPLGGFGGGTMAPAPRPAPAGGGASGSPMGGPSSGGSGSGGSGSGQGSGTVPSFNPAPRQAAPPVASPSAAAPSANASPANSASTTSTAHPSGGTSPTQVPASQTPPQPRRVPGRSMTGTHAQAAVAASNSQGGAGMTADIEHKED